MLSSLVQHIPKDNVLFTGGDMNAYTGKNRNKNFLRNWPNKDRKYQADFALNDRPTCLNFNTYTFINIWCFLLSVIHFIYIYICVCVCVVRRSCKETDRNLLALWLWYCNLDIYALSLILSTIYQYSKLYS